LTVDIQSHYCLQAAHCSSLKMTWWGRGSTLSLHVCQEIAEHVWYDTDDSSSPRASSGVRIKCQLLSTQIPTLKAAANVDNVPLVCLAQNRRP